MVLRRVIFRWPKQDADRPEFKSSLSDGVLTSKTAFNFVSRVRLAHDLPKEVETKCRPYEKQPETGYGEYAQCDFGERWIRLAVYVKPAFGFFGGVPRKMVYDQDKVFPVNENLGDLVLTGGFRPLVSEHGFDPVFCRKSDTKSKGKIENVVKYVRIGSDYML